MANDTEIKGWVQSPSGQGTLDILWSCLAVTSLCVWSAIHPDVAHCKGKSQNRLWVHLRRKASLAFGTLICPEMTVLMEIEAQTQSRRLFAICQDNKLTDWTVTHSRLAFMGGFAYQFNEGRS